MTRRRMTVNWLQFKSSTRQSRERMRILSPSLSSNPLMSTWNPRRRVKLSLSRKSTNSTKSTSRWMRKKASSSRKWKTLARKKRLSRRLRSRARKCTTTRPSKSKTCNSLPMLKRRPRPNLTKLLKKKKLSRRMMSLSNPIKFRSISNLNRSRQRRSKQRKKLRALICLPSRKKLTNNSLNRRRLSLLSWLKKLKMNKWKSMTKLKMMWSKKQSLRSNLSRPQFECPLVRARARPKSRLLGKAHRDLLAQRKLLWPASRLLPLKSRSRRLSPQLSQNHRPSPNRRRNLNHQAKPNHRSNLSSSLHASNPLPRPQLRSPLSQKLQLRKLP
mmetsp:Transcript_13843/g.18909  ORF Transcript_13843/g.18909 Transcript_13843/m.18909 type:complete len:329 (-) Transcript_13843:2180-3166(-)